jgi:hypothetical protein
MSIYDRLCELDERHKRYAKDTNIFLAELITVAQETTSDKYWVDQTGFPVDCSIHDLPTKVFRDAARLLAASRGRAITLSRLSRLALDSAISDRKDQSFTYLLSSTRNAESMSIYNAHMYFIEVLENICGVLNHLFEQAPPNSIEAPPSQGPQPVQNKRFVDWLEQSEPEASPLDAKDNTHQKTTMFWSIVYAYFRDILIIRKHLSQLTTMYKQRTISLVAWYSLNHVAFYMVKQRTASLFECKSDLDASCPEGLLHMYKSHGVAGAVHLAYQDHEQVLIAKTSLVTRPVRIELAAIGIIQFLSPTVAKVIGYRTAKLHRDAKYLESLSGTHVAIPFGTPIDTANGCTLRLDSDGSLYHASWYEDTARVLLREYSRMATLDCLCRQPRYYVHDPLTELLS